MNFTTSTFQSLLVLVFALMSVSLSAQSADLTISIQGTLKDANGAAVEDGEREVTFKLYWHPSQDSSLWTETATVNVVGGIYSHNLGSKTDLITGHFDRTVYLGITVGGIELSPRTEMGYAPYALSVNSAQRIAQQGCSGQVGDIKYSILPPEDFEKENGDCWVKMDGTDHPDSRLATVYGKTDLPDMSGLFIRATEYNDGNDPDRGPMADVTLQGDDNQRHGHSMESAGRHDHGYDRREVNTVNVGYAGSRDFFMNRVESSPLLVRTTSQEGEHSHTINEAGGNEARPKNMNFFIYIRIN